MSQRDLYLGLDLGTSGARAVVIDRDGREIAQGKSAMADHGRDVRDPAVWKGAAFTAVQRALEQVDARRIAALSVDGTSGTMLGVDAGGTAVTAGLMYNDPCPDPAILAAIASHAPLTSAAHGPTSGAARAVILGLGNAQTILHQADWISFHFSGRMVSDANNALKTGYDPVAGKWPAWLSQVGVVLAKLPPVFEPGSAIGPVSPAAVATFGFSSDCLVIAGTTDGCASFLATGADQPGEGVTALGTTLTVKLLSDRPIFAPEYGIYSHRLLNMWLAGGASNSGGAALLAHFTADDIATLSATLDPETDTGLDYYPLPKPGERFPIADPDLPPRVSPRPSRDEAFLQGLFEGVAGVEALAYRRLAELGAPALVQLRSVGGGASNPVWTRLRERKLHVPMVPPLSTEAAYGTALLALKGAEKRGGHDPQ